MQGLVISIIYGFANEEVQNVLRTHWKRRMLVRMVKREGRERTVSLKVSVRDMGDIGEEGDHSNITQLTVTWADLTYSNFKYCEYKSLGSKTWTNCSLLSRCQTKKKILLNNIHYKIDLCESWPDGSQNNFLFQKKTNCDVFKTCQILDVKKYICGV